MVSCPFHARRGWHRQIDLCPRKLLKLQTWSFLNLTWEPQMGCPLWEPGRGTHYLVQVVAYAFACSNQGVGKPCMCKHPQAILRSHCWVCHFTMGWIPGNLHIQYTLSSLVCTGAYYWWFFGGHCYTFMWHRDLLHMIQACRTHCAFQHCSWTTQMFPGGLFWKKCLGKAA